MPPKKIKKPEIKKHAFTQEEVRALSEYTKTHPVSINIQPLLHALNDGLNSGNFSDVFRFLRTHADNPLGINTLANQLVFLKTLTHSTTGDKSLELLTDHDISTNPPLVTSRNIHTCGAVSRPIERLGESFRLEHFKTTLFKVLLMLPGTSDIALRMMELAPQGKFNHNHDPLATPSAELAAVNNHLGVFKALIARPDFSLAQCNLDHNLGTSHPLIEIMARGAIPLKYIKALCANAKIDQLVKVNSFPTIEGMNLLMMLSYYGKIKACEVMIANGVDVSIVTKNTEGDKLSAISFAGPNILLIEKLIEAGCPYTGALLDLTGRMLAKGSLPIFEFMTNIYDLLAKRDFYQKAVEILNNTSTEEQCTILRQATERTLEATSEAASDDTALTTPIWLPPSIDILLLQYFIATPDEKEILANKIQELCASSAEVALEIISTLNAQYLDHPDVIVI